MFVSRRRPSGRRSGAWNWASNQPLVYIAATIARADQPGRDHAGPRR